MSQKENNPYPGFDHFVIAPGERLPGERSKRIRIIDSGEFVSVDLDMMTIEGDGGKINIRLNERAKYLSPATAEIYQHVILHALDQRRKVSTVVNWLASITNFTRRVFARTGECISTFTLAMYLDFQTELASPSLEQNVRSVFHYWRERKFPGVGEDLKNYLLSSKSPRKPSTIEIQNRSLKERPFSIAQVRSMLSRLDGLYAGNRIDPQINLLWKLIIVEGLRVSQLNLLCCGDVRVEPGAEEGSDVVFLNVPISKQHGTPARKFMREYRMPLSAAIALKDQLQFVRSLGSAEIQDDLPLFCVRKSGGKYEIRSDRMRILNLVTRSRPLIASGIDSLEDEDLFTRRFKHTKLTHLAMLGAPLEVLAHAGFHTTTGSVQHYVNLSEEVFLQYESQLSDVHTEVLHAFQGTLIDRGNAVRPEEKNRIRRLETDADLGSCSATPCGTKAPVGCYGCKMFEAFRDGAHQEVIDYLYTEKKKRIKMKLSPEVIARDDNLIAAVSNVISRISEEHSNASRPDGTNI